MNDILKQISDKQTDAKVFEFKMDFGNINATVKLGQN